MDSGQFLSVLSIGVSLFQTYENRRTTKLLRRIHRATTIQTIRSDKNKLLKK